MTDARVPEPDKPTPVWPVIEADYRAGVKSVRQIAGEHGISEGAIRKRAKAQDWARDLSAAIQAKAEAMVRREAVRTEVRESGRVPESEVIKANANVVYKVQIELRRDIERTSELFSGLLSELETSGVGADLIVEFFEAAHQPEDDSEEAAEAAEKRAARQREFLAKVLSLPGRVDSGKKLVEMLEKIVRMKREAYGIDKFVPDEGGVASKLTDAERASRLAAIFAAAQKRAQPDVA